MCVVVSFRHSLGDCARSITIITLIIVVISIMIIMMMIILLVVVVALPRGHLVPIQKRMMVSTVTKPIAGHITWLNITGSTKQRQTLWGKGAGHHKQRLTLLGEGGGGGSWTSQRLTEGGGEGRG